MALKKNDLNTLLNYKDATVLDLRGCHSLQTVDGLANFTNLTSLDLGNSSSLLNVNGLRKLANLISLDLSGCDSLKIKPNKNIMTTAQDIIEYQNIDETMEKIKKRSFWNLLK